MTMFGYVNLSEAREVAGITGEISKNKSSVSDEEDRSFNKKMLGSQIANVFKNNGIALSLLSDKSFRFSIDGMTNKLSVTLIGKSEMSEGLIDTIENALNTKENAKKLFYNLLYDSSKRGMISSDQLAKWKLFSEFMNISGKDIRDFTQTPEGLVDSEGSYARDIYKHALIDTKKIPAEFKGTAYDYFTLLEEDAMRHNIAEVTDLTLSIDYRGGQVIMPGETPSFDKSI